MAINTIEFAQIMQTELDEQVIADATSGWMESNSSRIKYSGGNEVKIPKVTMDGLGDYDRDKGFAQGSITLSWETRMLTQDRGRTFQLDAMDVDESDFVANASAVIGEFQRTKVVPEIDAYRYSTIAAHAAADGRADTGYTPAAADILSRLRNDIYSIYDAAGEIPLVITLSMPAAAVLEASTEITKHLDVIEFKKGDIRNRVRALDGIPIIKVPSVRMKSKYVLFDGKTVGSGTAPDQLGGGFAPASDAKDINWIIMAKPAVIAISKTDKIRVFDPSINQKADAWKIDYRKYHDLWILDNQLDKIRVNTK